MMSYIFICIYTLISFYCLYIYTYVYEYPHFFLRLEELPLIQLKCLEASRLQIGISHFPRSLLHAFLAVTLALGQLDLQFSLEFASKVQAVAIGTAAVDATRGSTPRSSRFLRSQSSEKEGYFFCTKKLIGSANQHDLRWDPRGFRISRPAIRKW